MAQVKKKRWMCLWERLCINMGLVLIKDGQHNPGQFELPPEDVRFYTMIYRGTMDGKFINTWVKFIYDEREGEVDVEITCRDPKLKGREKMVLTMPKTGEV